ncbi:MAG: hypothetical protein HZY74_05820 [Brevundimonas sp.]|nr:MAG: hypothetical protein HZY74_05820 [Brevundimonas sp.]
MAADHATEDEVNQLRSEIGMAVGEIGQITDTIYKLHPDLYSYVETQVETYGRVS